MSQSDSTEGKRVERDPTPEEKVRVYEALFHQLHMCRCITLDHKGVIKILDKIDGWSFAHNGSNGESDPDELVRHKFYQMAEMVGEKL